MSAFSSILGSVAQGYGEASQKEQQRQFADEQNKRSQFSDWLGKLAVDPSAPPETQHGAAQYLFELQHQPWNKAFKPDVTRLFAPLPPPEQEGPKGSHATQAMQGQAAGTARPTPGAEASAASGPSPQLTQPSAPPHGLLYSPEQQTQQAASKAGAIESAQQGAQLHSLVPSYGDNGQVTMHGVSGTGQPMGAPIENAVVPQLLTAQNRAIVPVHIVGSTGAPIPALQNKLTGEVYDQNYNLIPNAQIFAPSLVGHTSTESMDASGAVTKKTKPQSGQQGQPSIPRGAAPKLNQPAPPPGSAAMPAPATAPKPTAAGAVPAPAAGPLPRKDLAGQAMKPAVGSPDWIAKADPVSLEAWDWATQGRKPVGGAMAERQVRQRMAQMGYAQPAIAIPPAMQQKVQESFVARNSAIDIIDDIQRNKAVFNSLLSSGKIAVASDSDGNGILQRAAGLNDQEARVAGDFDQLIEHVNLLRGPLGATGFRSKEAWGALQAQRGKVLGDPRITDQVLTGMRGRLVGLNSADKLVLAGQGTSGAPATGGRRISKAKIDEAAKAHGVDSAVAEQQARDQGYEVY